MTSRPDPDPQEGFDYIIVGSGAGGAPLAARLAQAGKRVLVIEAGSHSAGRAPLDPVNEVSRVPALHAVSTEHDGLAWRFFVDHYRRSASGQLPDGIQEDPKWHKPDVEAGETAAHEGIFYPRSAGVGGCTVHNAMITIAGPDSDWDDLADFLGDDSWRGTRMRAYFQQLEHNDYQPAPDRTRLSRFRSVLHYSKSILLWLIGRTPDATGGRHGFDGWLHTSTADIELGLHDKQLLSMLAAALRQSKVAGLDRAWTLLRTLLRGRFRAALDPNHAQTQASSPEGIVLIPLAVYGRGSTVHQNSASPYAMRGRRSSPRELLLETVGNYPDRLILWTDCLVTKVILDDGTPPRAVGVELRRGARLYKAHRKPSESEGELQTVHVKPGGEVILAGGSFNTPQLLMLSGIGDREALASVPHRSGEGESARGIACRVHLPGVGRNLQDRYEVSLVSEMKKDFSLLDGATFALPADPSRPDPHLLQWREEGTGLYTSNGAVLGLFKRSRPELTQPDLFIFGIPSQFKGYEVGYSEPKPHNLFTWVILKSHTQNRDGVVRLRNTDPRETPKINFHSFQTASRPGESARDPDVLGLLDGVKFVRGILDRASWVVKAEVHPGDAFQGDEQIKDWIRRDAWGHHACGTCRMGPDGDPAAVLDSRFRVRGVKGLRVVDASIFPRIPGYFIVTNIYMASEKAADVILEESNAQPTPGSPTYPAALQEREAVEIEKRREAVDPAWGGPVASRGEWAPDVSGLALSGGGVRSATFCLGVLQSLARSRLLRRFDLLSTVSGGGYIGGFLGRFYDRLRTPATAGTSSAPPPADRVEHELADPDSKVVDWLRKHGNYIAPQGRGDERLNCAVFVRNLLSVHFVVGIAIFTLFGLANAIRYGLFDRALAVWGLTMSKASFPLGHLMASWFGPFFSPWFILVDLLLLFLVLPRITGYWIVSQDRHESFKSIPTVLMFLVAGLLLFRGVHDGLMWEPLLFGLSLLSSLIFVELAWARGRDVEAAVGTGGIESQRLRTRNDLTYDLGLALTLTAGAAIFALVDTMAHGLHEWTVRGNGTYAKAFAGLAASLSMAYPIGRYLASLLTEKRPGPASTLVRIVKEQIVPGMAGGLLFGLTLILYSFTAHAAWSGGSRPWMGFGLTVLAFGISLVLAHPSAQTFVNRSSLAQTYAARLARAYLGASNPLRHRPSGMNVAEVIPGDDVPSICEYRPQDASGPLHLINVTIDQTVDAGSLLRKRDRQGEIVAVSNVGMSIGEKCHNAWDVGTSDGLRKAPTGLKPLGRPRGEPHPLVDVLDRSTNRAEMLSLRQWIGVSGAAIDPGRGQLTSLAMALLTGLVNLRTGYWWDSGIAEADRTEFPRLTVLRRLLYVVSRVFTMQSLLIHEWIARFPGTRERFWHLSDGGFFENLGGYELVRRRVPRIVLCDAGADPNYEFQDLAELIRKTRIDFAARIESFTPDEITTHVPPALRSEVGTLDELRPTLDASGVVAAASPRNAALFWVHYPGRARRSVLLYIKAKLNGRETADVRNYHVSHPEFPHEATLDQAFDEGQWESYRKLGEHLSSPLFASLAGAHGADWLWQIALPLSESGAP